MNYYRGIASCYHRSDLLPCKPIPPKTLGVADSPPKLTGWTVRNPLSRRVFLEGRPLNLGGDMSPRKFRGHGLTGYCRGIANWYRCSDFAVTVSVF